MNSGFTRCITRRTRLDSDQVVEGTESESGSGHAPYSEEQENQFPP